MAEPPTQCSYLLPLWEKVSPSAAALASDEPFCIDTLTFPQWLQFIFLPTLYRMLEAGELLEHFQWLTEDQSRHLDAGKKQEVAFEMADVLLYLIQMGNELGVDLIDAAQRKVALNEQKYPVEQAKGSSKKYDEL